MAVPRRHRIAIVDDDESVRDSLRFLLELLGHSVAVFASAAEFLESGSKDALCLILDHHMPRMTGLELAERLHADRMALPIVLITASATPAIAARAAELGIDRMLEKPLNARDLMDFINDAQRINKLRV